jgi:hypothetical protein
VEETVPPLTAPNQKNMQTLTQAAQKLNSAQLSFKIGWLRSHRSNDPLQQMQTDAIVELYDAVKQIQEHLWPMLIDIPDVSAVRAAAAAAGQTGPTTGSNQWVKIGTGTHYRGGGDGNMKW